MKEVFIFFKVYVMCQSLDCGFAINYFHSSIY